MNSSQLTRRTFGRLCALAGLLRASRRPALAAEKLQWDAQPDRSRASSRNYRADAQVVLLSVPVLRRAGVGAGSVTWSENAESRLLDFTGYSFPERAAGLNRFGFIRELSRKPAERAESIYFGLMTASPEESAEEARTALRKQTAEQLYTAIEGRIAPGEVETVTSHFVAPSRLTAAQHDELLSMARHALSAASQKPPEFDAHAATEPTFLQALAGLLQDPSRTYTRYIYNARLYDLWLRRFPDSKAAAYFREKRLIPHEANVTRVEGRLRRQAGGKDTNFQIWMQEGARPLPLRIEYQAKPYLRLTFEADDSSASATAGRDAAG